FLSTTDSQNLHWSPSRELSHLIACSHTNPYLGRQPDFSCIRVVWEFHLLKTLPISFHLERLTSKALSHRKFFHNTMFWD
ncbi:hypothetical protein MXB_1084, partial [Myxobolus squamalis]